MQQTYTSNTHRDAINKRKTLLNERAEMRVARNDFPGPAELDRLTAQTKEHDTVYRSLVKAISEETLRRGWTSELKQRNITEVWRNIE